MNCNYKPITDLRYDMGQPTQIEWCDEIFPDSGQPCSAEFKGFIAGSNEMKHGQLQIMQEIGSHIDKVNLPCNFSCNNFAQQSVPHQPGRGAILHNGYKNMEMSLLGDSENFCLHDERFNLSSHPTTHSNSKFPQEQNLFETHFCDEFDPYQPPYSSGYNPTTNHSMGTGISHQPRGRLNANNRERKRTFKINERFNELRSCVPTFPSERLAKIDTLRLATAYIALLQAILNSNENPRTFIENILQRNIPGCQKWNTSDLKTRLLWSEWMR